MIEKYPSKILWAVSEPCDDFHQGVAIADMLVEEAEKLKWGRVVGLAAPQIGINKRVFIAQDVVYINPEMVWMSPQARIFKEGCYSLVKDKFDYEVRRSLRIKLKWLDVEGKIRTNTFDGFSAQVIQHEYDHLEGRLCIGQ